MSGSGISWAICKSAPRSRQITMPALHYSSLFTGQMPFLPHNQQCQSTEGNLRPRTRSYICFTEFTDYTLYVLKIFYSHFSVATASRQSVSKQMCYVKLCTQTTYQNNSSKFYNYYYNSKSKSSSTCTKTRAPCQRYRTDEPPLVPMCRRWAEPELPRTVVSGPVKREFSFSK